MLPMRPRALDVRLRSLATASRAAAERASSSRQLRSLVGGRRRDRAAASCRTSSALPRSGTLLKNAKKLVELLLRDRVELVVVAAGAAERQAEPDRGRGVDAVGDVLDAVLLVDDAALGVADGDCG